MLIASGFNWFYLLPGVEDGSLLGFAGPRTYLVVVAWFSAAALIGLAFLARRGLDAALQRGGVESYYAEDSLTPRTIGEYLIGGLYDLMKGMMEAKYARMFLPLVAALALFIFFNNAIGLIPGFPSITDNLNMNLAMAITTMCTYVYVGLRYDPKGFVHHIIGPVWWMAVLFVPLELMTLFLIRPFSLSIRLAANMMGDHLVFNIMSGLLSWPIAYPVVFLGLGLLVCVIQAFVFALLTSVYISLAVPHGDHHGESH